MTRKKKRSAKQIALLVVAILLVTSFYLIFGETIAERVSSFDYSRTYRHFNAHVPEGLMEVHVIDVGQGDCTLIRTSEGSILIDASTSFAETSIEAYLSACGVDSLDYFICTHLHADHIGGADAVVEKFDIETILMTGEPSDEKCYRELCEVIEARDATVKIPTVGEAYMLGKMEFCILAPLGNSENENDESLVVRLTYGDTAFLFMGDAAEATERAMLEAYDGTVLDCDYLKVGHHGASTSTTEKFLAAVTPTVASISCGRDNAYGHPHLEVTERLEAAGATVLRTDVDGSFVIVSDGKVLSY